jgi:hypothetical protein
MLEALLVTADTKAISKVNQIADWNTWCPGAEIGEVIATELNPVIY